MKQLARQINDVPDIPFSILLRIVGGETECRGLKQYLVSGFQYPLADRGG